MNSAIQNDAAAPDTYSIVVGIDYSEVSELALVQAVFLARARGPSHVHVVRATPAVPPLGRAMGTPDLTLAAAVEPVATDQIAGETPADVQKYVEKVLARLGDAAEGTPSIRWTIHLRLSSAAQAIAQLAADVQADLVIVGTHGRRGLERFLLGSVAEGVVRLAPCPVLVVRPVGSQPESESPQIEPPCPDCVEARRASHGAELWCERHRAHHERAHTYHFTPFRDSHQSSFLVHPEK